MDIIDKNQGTYNGRGLNILGDPTIRTFGLGDYDREVDMARRLNKMAEEAKQREDETDPVEKDSFDYGFNFGRTTEPVQMALEYQVKNKESIIGDGSDTWRQMNIQGHTVNLDKKLQNLFDSEGKWYPEIQEAKEYVDLALELQDLNKQDTSYYNTSQLEAHNTRKSWVLSRINEIEPNLREYSRYNPYIRDIFYETNWGKATQSGVLTGTQRETVRFRDWRNDFLLDFNDANNLSHAIQTKDGAGGSLSKETLNNLFSLKTNINDPFKLLEQQDALNQILPTAKTQLDVKTEDIQAKINTIKKGNWLFDPTKLSEEYKQEFQRYNQEGLSLSDPKSWYYALPHIGSSYSEFGAIIGQMGASMMMNHLAKGALAATTGGTLPLLYAMTEAGVNLAIANYMRESETASETFSAMNERVARLADERKVDLGEIIRTQTTQLANLGYDVENMSSDEITKAATAHHIRSGNDNYDEVQKEAEKGLEVVRLTNNALSIPDYIESTMFSYGGSYLSKAYGLMRMGSREVLPQTVQYLDEPAQGIIDRTITKVANKMSKNPMGKVAADRALHTTWDLGKKLGLTYFTERTEEGQQHLVSSRYKEGKYNNVEDYSLLDGAAHAFQLGVEANLAYYGLHPDKKLNTDKELENVMNIGGFTGLFMTGVYSAPGFYQDIQQIATDQNLRGLVADNYATAERDAKIEQIMNAVTNSKDGNFGRIRKSLESLKNYKPEGVTNEMIDDDIDLTARIASHSSNKALSEVADKIGAPFGSKTKTQIIRNAIHLEDRLRNQQEVSEGNTAELQRLEQEIFNDKSNDTILQTWYDQYSENQENPISFEEYKKRIVDNTMSLMYYEHLQNLQKQLKRRKNDLTKLKDDLGLDVNVEGITGIQEYIDAQLKKSKSFVSKLIQNARDNGMQGTDEQILKQIKKEQLTLPKQDELQTLWTAKNINQGAVDNLRKHMTAYTLGLYFGDISGYKPIWSNLTEAQQQKILDDAAKEDEAAGRTPRTRKQIISTYNLEVAREWNDRNLDEDVADKAGLARRKAQAIIQMDLKNLNDEETVAREERVEEHGTPIETEPEEESKPEETETSEPTPTTEPEETPESTEETTEEEQPPLDEIETEDDLLLKELDKSNDESLEVGDEIETIDQEEASQYEDTRAENQKVKDELDSYEEVHPLDRPEAAEDSYSEGSEQTEDSVEEDTTDAQDEVQESEQPTIPENLETPTASDSVVPGQNEITEEQEIPGMDIGQPVQVFEGIDGQIHYDPTGEQNVDNSIVIADGDIRLEEDFDSTYDGNIGPSAMQNVTADTDSRNTIITHNKQKRMYVKNTFFFQPTATEAMPITVANKPVVFKTKDGKIAKRGTGSELAEKLATPGWLKSIDDAYCIVTSSTHTLKGQSAIDNLAIHIIIEKDGVIYNTSLRAISDKLISDLLNQGLSQEQVNEQISGLRSLREKIIRQYAPNYGIDGKLPVEAAKHVKPTNLRISNGTLNNQTDNNGNPVFRGLHEVADFGISSDPQVLSEQIKSGEVELGYGLGAFTLGEPFSIMRLDQSGDASAQGRGYAGKIFYIPAKQNTPSGTTTLPIMLSEEVHRLGVTSAYDIPTQKNIDGSINRGTDGKPIPMTTAELIYELVVNGMFSPELDEALLNILANTGPHTVAMNLEGIEKRKFNFMLRKLFHVFERGNKKFLIYGTDTETNDGSYTTKIVDLASVSNSERKRIIYQIQKNLHWNTDKDALMAPISDAIINAVVSYAKNNPDTVTSDDQQIRLGNDAITFSLRDIGYTLENGVPVKKGETPILASWFITHKKLKTDLGEHAFSAPFMYAGDPKVEETARPVTKTKDVTSKGEEPKHPITQKPAEPKPTTKKATIAEPATEENLKKYGLEIPKDRKLITGRVWAIIDDKQNPGKKKVTQAPKQNVDGVFSTERGTGTMNPKEAKNWLMETLGLRESDIVLIKAALSTYSGEEAFGVVRAAMNAITGGLETKITLSEQSGEGIEYHEGFHYVSLLLLNPQQRQLIYQEYANAIGSETIKDEEVEELLAEDFRKWMLMRKHPWKNLSKTVKEFFVNLKDLINIWTSKHLGFGKPSVKRSLFKAIRDGKFKESKPAEQVVQDFYLKHPKGFFYYIPGLTQEQLKKMPSILDSDTYYNIVDALTSTALATFNIRTRDDVRNLKLNEIFDNIQDFLDNGWIAEENVLLALDVVENKEVFVESIKQLLGDLGIKKNDLKETEEQYQNQRDTGETADNVWDKNQGDVSKKDNIAFKAKLFFYSVPKYQYNYTKDEETGAIIKTLEPVLDDMFGMPVSWEFNVAWNKIMESLWDIDTYQDIVDRCAELGNTDEFFAALYDMLTSKEYPLDDNTKTQLEVTIKSAKVLMNTLNVKHGKPKFDSSMSDEQIENEIKRALSESIWEVQDSDKLRKVKRLPRRWSQAFFASNALTRDSKGNHLINGNFGAYFVQRRTKINSLVKKLSKNKNTIISDTDAQTLKDTFIELLNAMSIPFDSKAYDYLFQNDARNFIKFWNNNQGGGISLNKGIFTDIAIMYSQKRGYIKSKSGEKARSLDKIFTHYNPDALINQLAYAYGKTHPSPQEFSVTGADGALVYPISENNYMCDQIRNINKNAHGKREQILKTPYSKRSLIANAEGVEFKLHNFLALEIDDSSRDYFGITAIEDYIAKLTLTFNNQMILPTMSDKKTWYSISGLNLVKNIIQSKTVDVDYANWVAVTGEAVDETKVHTYQPRRFSDETLKIFVNYWLDEFDAVFDYYVHKPWVEKHPTEAVKNYHGKISNGKMDGSGNGGRFRYFSSLNINGEERHINEELAINEASVSNDVMLKYLKDLKVFLLGGETVNNIQDIPSNALIWDVINNQLVGATKRELKALTKQGIVGKKNGLYINKLIPNNIWDTYKALLNGKMYGANEQALLHEDILFSIIGSHVANQALSIIEVEKCFTGDPAYYKWSKFNKKTEDGVKYQVIRERAVDKIKRLSAVLSTGTNLRTVWETAEESDTRISVLQLSDNEMGSDVYDKLYSIFRNSVLRDLYSRKHPNLTDDEIIQSLNTPEKEEAFYETLSTEEKDFVDKNSKASANPYNFKYKENENGELEIDGGEINQSDAAVYIRPALYRKIMKALGNWSDAIEEAYNIMEGEDESWMEDPVLYAKTTAALINPLKMVYFGNHRNAKMNLNIPVFDKMAMFPMFKCLCKADNRHLYDRMNNEELGVIDMLTFESAVKVGGRKKFTTYNDPKNESFNMEGLNKPSYNKTNKEGDLPVFYQDISNLRLQLNTDPHEHKDRSFGTQAVKICLGNVIDDRTYGENKGLSKNGKEIKTEVMQAINALTRKGAWEVINKFFNDGVISNKKLSDYLVKQAMTSGMSREILHALTLDENGEFRVPLAAMSNRNWIESRILSFINKEVVDLNTYGGAAIQMSSFGFKRTTVAKSSDYSVLNNGEKLNFLNEDGSMDVMLSTNFFRHIVPAEYQKSYGMMRNWLLEHKIIGPDSKPFGIGYRIPTQGLSSTFSFKVMDVLPDRIGDTIVVPDEFTAMTGSDFDVDKLYIASLSYDKDDNIIQLARDEYGNILSMEKQSKEALLNAIIQNYQLVVSDAKNMAETRASIDTLTSILKNEILPEVDPKSQEQVLPMAELLPSFQSERKEEYTGGKTGIGPFALNSTNHCLTQLVHLNMLYSGNNRYNLGQIDEINGRDGYRILDWLSAMINAHVDVAKDPYIMTLNVNQITYNMTNLLLRGGMGKTTFYFLAQPVLKDLAKQMLNNRGVYGVVSQSESDIIKKLANSYLKGLERFIEDPEWEALYNSIAEEFGFEGKGDNKTKIDYSTTFDQDLLKSTLRASDTPEFYYNQLKALLAYKQLTPDAKRLAELVHRSQIDTKKYGNNLALMTNFKNSYDTFISDNSDYFSIRGVDESVYDRDPQYALRTYFGETFLSTKLHFALSLPRKILRNQAFTANKAFLNIFISSMATFSGLSTVEDRRGHESIGYKHQGDKKLVNKFFTYVDSIVHARIARTLPALQMTDEEFNEMFYGVDNMSSYLTAVKNYILENKDSLPTLIAQDGTFKNEMLNYLQESPANNETQYVNRIILSESSMNNPSNVEDRLISAFAELLDHPDEIIRMFAEKLVKYAYYTSYDQRGVNSFFHLVPMDYKRKIGYVDAIKDALKLFKEDDMSVAYEAIAEANDNAAQLYFPSIYVSIARNMWQDESIVPTIELETDYEKAKENKKTPDVKLKSSIANNRLYLEVFATGNTDKDFVKITSGTGKTKHTELYQRVGDVVFVNEEGEIVKSGRKGVFKRIPKLGVQDGDFKVMELFKTSNDKSAFEQNAFEQHQIISDEEIAQLASSKALYLKKGSNWTIKYISKESLSIDIKLKDIAAKNESSSIGDNTVETFNDTSIDPNESVGENIITDPEAYFGQEELESGESFVTDLSLQEEIANEDYLEQLQQEIDEVGQMIENYGDPGQLTEDYDDTGQIVENITDQNEPYTRKTYSGKITKLNKNQIFVFGSNTQGRHGKGAALIAKNKFSAVYGQAEGPQGQSYAIITKDLTKHKHPSRTPEQIKEQIHKLYEYARKNPNKEFVIAYSATGSNLNAYTNDEMAQFFASERIPRNIIFEEDFYKIVKKYNDESQSNSIVDGMSEQDIQAINEQKKKQDKKCNR